MCPRDDVVPVAGRFLGKSPPGRGGGAAARALPRLCPREDVVPVAAIPVEFVPLL